MFFNCDCDPTLTKKIINYSLGFTKKFITAQAVWLEYFNFNDELIARTKAWVY